LWPTLYFHQAEAVKLYYTCILPIFLYSSECWAVTKRDVLKIDALDQWHLWELLGIKRYHHIVERCHTFPLLSTNSFSLLDHSVQMPDETDAKKILTASPLENWRRPPGHPRTTRMKPDTDNQ